MTGPVDLQAGAARRSPYADLLDMVRANPDDDEARQIYADALLEAGDPQGEFIAIQFKLARGQASEGDVIRLRELYRDHEAGWLGDLALVLVGRVYRAGFLERAALGSMPAGDEARAIWTSAASDAQLGTVRVLEPAGLGISPNVPGVANAEAYRRFALSPAMNHLREVAILSQGMLDEICNRTRAWSFSCLVFHCPLDVEMLGRILSTKALPHLREIAVRVRPELVPKLTEMLGRWSGRVRLDALSLLLWTEIGAGIDYGPFTRWLSSATSLAPVPRLGLWLPLSRVYARAAGGGQRGLEVEVRDDLLLADVLGRLSGFDELVVRPPPREACCNLDSPWHFAAALRQLKAARVELPKSWAATMARGY